MHPPKRKKARVLLRFRLPLFQLAKVSPSAAMIADVAALVARGLSVSDV